MSKDTLIPPSQPTGEQPSKDRLEELHGKVSEIIGSGRNAQNSIVYKTIAWSFLSGILFSSIIIAYVIYKGEGSPIDSIKNVWSIFIPVITLSLGYIFGKSQ